MKVTILDRIYDYKVLSVKTNVTKITIETTRVLVQYSDETIEEFDSDRYCVEVE